MIESNEPWLTLYEVEDRLIGLSLGRIVEEGGFEMGKFLSEDVALGLSDRGFTIHVYDRKNLATVKMAFEDAPQVKVQKASKQRPLG